MLRALNVLSLGIVGMLASVYWPVTDVKLLAGLFLTSSIVTILGLIDWINANRAPRDIFDTERETALISVATADAQDTSTVHPGMRAFGTLTTRRGDRWQLVLQDAPVTRANENIGSMPCTVWLDRHTGMPMRCALDGKPVPYLLIPARI
jgi:hypothetical protein